ncbi:MAG: hypothetical protein OXN17_20990 [Candidatus Poribacteria bacterium]|nr:hypothetical protein [Candidatus Poribacteria bacterium]MDE0505131.1 hypothetical protein [Candidatus Poribacteria bacterium]
MGIPFFIVFALSIVFLSVGVTGWGDFASISWKFSIDSQFVSELNRGVASKELRDAFENNGFSISENLDSSRGDNHNSWWILLDEDSDRSYTVRREGDALNVYHGTLPHLHLEANYSAVFRCFSGFMLFFISLYLMGFFLYLEERESGRIMKNVKSFAKLRQFFERHESERAGKQQ